MRCARRCMRSRVPMRHARTPVASQTMQRRSMATLKDLKARISSIAGIQKITSSMKMVAAARMQAQERLTKGTRPFYNTFLEGIAPLLQRDTDVEGKNQLYVVVTTDKGLCGSINNKLLNELKAELANTKAAKVTLALLGTKGRNGLQARYADQVWFHVADLHKEPLTFIESGAVAERLAAESFDVVSFKYNLFETVLAQHITTTTITGRDTFAANPGVEYELEGDSEILLADLWEYAAAVLTHGCLLENALSELGSRMTSMDNATKNAGEIQGKLQLLYNRTRQAAITTELTEIISGAEALEE